MTAGPSPPSSPPPGPATAGRVADRATIAALGWRGGDWLTVTAEAGVMIARRDPGGLVTVPARPYVVIPAALRRRCGLRAGDHVLLAAVPGQDISHCTCSLAVTSRGHHERRVTPRLRRHIRSATPRDHRPQPNPPVRGTSQPADSRQRSRRCLNGIGVRPLLGVLSTIAAYFS
jgi:bifunctional DNA-binding transcriptional regulator/antitoxin component of YhaV-PrlF toxin-antitoxin module